MADTQTDIAERLQMKLLERFEKLLKDGTLAPTDAATLARLLSQNGWTFDESRMPKALKERLTKVVDFDSHETREV